MNNLVAIYIRLSKEDDNLGASESIQNQKKLLTDYVLDNGYKLVDIYVDDGYTGTNFNRPNFQRMLKDIEMGKVNMVITKDLSRLSRDYIGTGEFVEKWFPAHNVRYIALTDMIDTAIDSANNDIAPFKAILNDMYAKDLSKKIRTALHTMQMEGKWVGGCPPFGYSVDPNDKNHLVVEKNEGLIVKRIFNLFLSGYKINQIKNILNNDQVPTFYMMRKRNFNSNIYWSDTTIKNILKNPLYTGDMVQNRRNRISYKYRKIICNPKEKWIIKENTHEALIDKKSFELVQAMLPKQKQRNDKRQYFLLDGLLKCADCGNNISIKARRANGKSTTVCNYYRQFQVKYKRCTSHGFDYDTLEKGVLEEVSNNLKKIKNIDAKLKNSYSTKFNIDDSIDKIDRDIAIFRNSLDDIYIEKITNKITVDMYERIKVKIDDAILQKEQVKEELLKKVNPKSIEELVVEYLDTDNPSRELILKLIKYINIHKNGDIDIHFNFKELNII